jgi:hypothetical protein
MGGVAVYFNMLKIEQRGLAAKKEMEGKSHWECP